MPADHTATHSLLISILHILLWVGFVVVLLASVFGFLGHLDWRLDLFAHFRLQYAVLFLVILVLAIIFKNQLLSIMTILFLVIQLIYFIPFYLTHHSPQDGKGFLVLMANVKKDNHDYDRTVQYIAKSQPDIAILAEVDGAWYKALAPLKKAYPYEVAEIREDYSGMLLLSKKPLVNPRIERLGRRELPTVTAEATIAGKLVTIMGTHPFPPFGARSDALRNDQMKAIGEYIALQKRPVILTGDLNSSPFSYAYRLLMSKAPLVNCANGFGYQVTWHARPHIPPLGLSIDHCLHTPGITVVRSEVGEDIGSDHRPLLNWFSH